MVDWWWLIVAFGAGALVTFVLGLIGVIDLLADIFDSL